MARQCPHTLGEPSLMSAFRFRTFSGFSLAERENTPENGPPMTTLSVPTLRSPPL